MIIRELMRAHPRAGGSISNPLAECIERCFSCAQSCTACAEECEQHASHHQHCKICAAECRRCEESARRAMQDVGGASGRVQTN